MQSAAGGSLSGGFAVRRIEGGYALVFHAVLPETQLAIAIFDERGAVLYPVAVIAVQHAFDPLHLWTMNMSADDAVEAASCRLMRRSEFKTTHVVPRITHAGFDPRGQ